MRNKIKLLVRRLKNKIKEDKTTFIVYLILRVLVILCMIREVLLGNYLNAGLCVLSLVLFLVPTFFEERFKVDIPPVFEIVIMLFIFSAEILGEINNFYMRIPYWDMILHTLNGFLAAAVGYSLVYLLNENSEKVNLSPIFVSLVAICFSMTIGVAWEFFEFGMDQTFKLDMQKDSYTSNIYTVDLDPDLTNDVIAVNDIDKTVLYDKDGNILAQFNSFIDIGLSDTMFDMGVNFIGAIVFGVLGYFYMKNKDRLKVADKFIIKAKL